MDVIVIKNLRKEKPKDDWDVKVDRSSILGNPFHMNDESQRDMVCDKYEKYFYKNMEENEIFRNEVMKLCNLYIEHEQLHLYCWCYPKRCHAETIKKYIEGRSS